MRLAASDPAEHQLVRDAIRVRADDVGFDQVRQRLVPARRHHEADERLPVAR